MSCARLNCHACRFGGLAAAPRRASRDPDSPLRRWRMCSCCRYRFKVGGFECTVRL